MFEGDYGGKCAGKFPLVSMGGRAEIFLSLLLRLFHPTIIFNTNSISKLKLNQAERKLWTFI